MRLFGSSSSMPARETLLRHSNLVAYSALCISFTCRRELFLLISLLGSLFLHTSTASPTDPFLDALATRFLPFAAPEKTPHSSLLAWDSFSPTFSDLLHLLLSVYWIFFYQSLVSESRRALTPPTSSLRAANFWSLIHQKSRAAVLLSSVSSYSYPDHYT